MSTPDYLADLNKFQREAVTSPANSLQILAGPGSGKTQVLTTRVAWLVKQRNVRPSSVVVVTFTRKAAREMAERLEQPHVLGLPRTNYLRMGTFHSFCCSLLRRHVEFTSLKRNFVIADEYKSKHLMETTVKELKEKMSPINKTRKPADFRNFINDAKCQGIDHLTYMGLHKDDRVKRDTAMVYTAYEEKLEQANMIDFNGILLKARDLFKQHPSTVDFVSHVLVDEFQDTNGLQYELLLLLTRHGGKPFTIVGDPDQSIFGWRFADKENFSKMELDFKGTVIVNLKQNYRSTKTILSNATHVVSLDLKRKQREFYTENHAGIPISTLHTQNETDEAKVVAEEIKRVVKYSNGLVSYKDIAILFRMNYLTLNFEQALLRAKVPFILVSGTRFLDRMEIKDILAYLSFFYNPVDTAAFVRLVNAPKRGLGDTSVKKILALTASKNWTLIETMQNIVNHHPSTSSIRITGKARSGLQDILTLHLEIEAKMKRLETPSSLLNHIVESTGYMDYLKSNYEKDHESKERNVKELIDFAHRQVNDQSETEELVDPVGQFLESVTLCGDSKEHDDAKEGKVSLITIHGSKGLEWTTVFVAGCEDGIVPMTNTNDPDEESRLMYVAMTRAKCFLYCTNAISRQQYGVTNDTNLSRFLSALPADGYQNKTPAWNAEVRRWVATVLRLSYVEDDTLRLEDEGSEYKRSSTRFDEYSFDDYGGCGYNNNYDGDSYDDNDHFRDYNDYNDHFRDYNDYNDRFDYKDFYDNLRGYNDDFCDSYDHFRDYSSAGNRGRKRNTNNFRMKSNLPGITSASAIRTQLALPAPPSESTKKRKHQTTPINVKSEPGSIQQHQQQNLGGVTIKAEDKNSQSTLRYHFQRKTSDQKLKSEPTIIHSAGTKNRKLAPFTFTTPTPSIQQKQTSISIKAEPSTSTTISIQQKKRKHNTTTISLSLSQCVSKGLQKAGEGKSFFTEDDAITAVESMVRENGEMSTPAGKMKEQIGEQLGNLVLKGSLFRINKAGVSRFYMAE